MHPIDQETGWKSDMRSCIMPWLPTHLVQELNVCTVACSICTNTNEKTWAVNEMIWTRMSITLRFEVGGRFDYQLSQISLDTMQLVAPAVTFLSEQRIKICLLAT